MVFSSLPFLFGYLPVVLAVLILAPLHARNFCLFLVSLIFYGWSEPVYIVIMLISTFVDYYNGRMVDKYRDDRKKAKRFVWFSVIFNLSLLGFFKYADFFILNLQALGLPLSPLHLSLPVGISFYTFQTMSYPIDVYRKQAPVQKSVVSFGAYVTLFPQLIAGPIVRYKDIAEQLDHRQETADQFALGVQRFVAGLAKKVLLANSIGALWDTISALPASEMSVTAAWLGIIAFAFQIYFDFSGYSDMAIGLGKMLGFEFLENFNYPYISRSITEFWRRWHISLSTWFRDYVYIPLGGSR
ncbi:MBOAT family O-acyltransferase, partial [Holdemania filiformis]|uniref:MBOAT family O-acyltransferase n=1 Tax=Holdemania filiformis TaxID=61171 RepID=UPI00242C5345